MEYIVVSIGENNQIFSFFTGYSAFLDFVGSTFYQLSVRSKQRIVIPAQKIYTVHVLGCPIILLLFYIAVSSAP